MAEPGAICPGCGVVLKANPRHPRAFCATCVAGATDGADRALWFTNAAVSGGLTWRRADGIAREAIAVACLIGGQEVLVQEGKFGGVVAEPLSPKAKPRRLTDLIQDQ